MSLPPGLCIVAAAINQDGKIWSLPVPARHHNVIHHMVEHGVPTPVNGEQGFLLSDGRFVMRKAALRVAEKADQLKQQPVTPIHGLFSEDVW